jgi:hypothetical protein
MSQFQVPQFIETEAKIVGPLTIRQFLYIGVAGLLSFFFFFILKAWLWIILTIIMGTAALALAFIKYSGRPLTVILKSALFYVWKPKLYLWQREEAKLQMPTLPKIPTAPTAGGPTSKLKNLWLSLTTKQPPIKPRG